MTRGVSSIDHRLETYRNYLMLLASARIDANLRGRVDPADLVRDPASHASEPDFRGRRTAYASTPK
jgi:hypothetical protein